MHLDQQRRAASRESNRWPVRVRPADFDDSPFIARAILMASRSHLARGLWDVVVPGSEEDRLDFIEFVALMECPSFCHYANFLIAEHAGQAVAAMAAYDSGEAGLLSPGHLIGSAFEQFGWSDTELDAAYQRLESFQAGVPEQKKGVWTIEWVATMPAARRRGVAGRLLEALLEQGHHRGLRMAQVTTAIGNSAAIAVYESAGFVLAERKLNEAFSNTIGAPGMVRFERTL